MFCNTECTHQCQKKLCRVYNFYSLCSCLMTHFCEAKVKEEFLCDKSFLVGASLFID